MWSQIPPEAIPDVVNFKNFLGEHAPSLRMLPLAMIFPCWQKILYKTLHTHMHALEL